MTNPLTPPLAEGIRHSIWDLTTPPDASTRELPPPLAETLSCDVCVVGAGMAGLSVAYELSQRGRSVVVLDDGPVGGGETGRTTAHIATAFDDYYHEVERIHGTEAMRRLGASFRAGIDRIASIVQQERIDCDFTRVDGWWFAVDDDGVQALEAELEAAHRAGFSDVTREATWPMPHLTGATYLRWPGQAQFHPLRYLEGLVRAIVARGGQFYSQAHVRAVQDPRDEAFGWVETDRGIRVKAKAIVVATNTPMNDLVTMHTKQAPYRTYVVAMRVPRGTVPLGLYWDTLDPYHYVRLYHGGDEHGASADDVLLVGGEDHKTGQEGDESANFDRLEAWTRARFPVTDVVARWSGQVLEPVDQVAFIGRNPGDRHVYIATGDSGNGITHGAIAGLLIADLVDGVANPWEALFAPSRISLKALPAWIGENSNVAAQYADLVTPGEVPTVQDVLPGQGRIVRDGLRKLAVYRDEQGTLHLRSALCTHLGCVVDWNGAERSWDCPCHGSRFSVDGAVINGPAVSALKAIDPSEVGGARAPDDAYPSSPTARVSAPRGEA